MPREFPYDIYSVGIHQSSAVKIWLTDHLGPENGGTWAALPDTDTTARVTISRAAVEMLGLCRGLYGLFSRAGDQL
jgi:hypothetical protein